MDVFSIIGFLGGIALFLYGMRVMGTGLEAMAGGRLEGLLARLCSTTWRGVLLGAAATAAIQSSSATTVMVIGFVNSGIMQLRQAVGVIMGANLGTTVTSWILSLTGIEGDNTIVRLLKPSSLAPLLALAGVILVMRKKRSAAAAAGGILAGLGILFFGMEMMSEAVKPLADMPEFTRILTLFSNPLAGLAAGIILTAIVQSSSASVGILQALAVTGGVTFASAIPIVMGQNIGTCVTALISGIGATRNAKRASFVHLYFNVIGTAVLLALFYGADALFGFAFFDDAVQPVGIAVIHTAFNVASTFILLPFASLLQKLAELTVRDKGVKEGGGMPDVLDERFLRVPATALTVCREAYERMTALSQDNFRRASEQFGAYDKTKSEQITEAETQIDAYQDRLGSYMIKLSATELSDRENAELTKLMYAIGDVERIGDHAESLNAAAGELASGTVRLSDEAIYERGRLMGAVGELLSITVRAIKDSDTDTAGHVEPFGDVIGGLCSDLKRHHIERLQSGACNPAAAPLYDRILTDCERITDHCSNLAVSVIQRYDDRLTAHEYLRRLRECEPFGRRYAEYKEKYGL